MVSVGMVSKLENGKGVNLKHTLRVMDGLGLTMLVLPKVHAPWLEQAAAHEVRMRPGNSMPGWQSRGAIRMGVILGCGPRSVRKCDALGVLTRLPPG
ncbi:hypothetical protein [Cupriavidus necator]|uniref:hypothetical protein n=1 Tax=Cupriavidus necator TaxID=106590 RepID=UPI001D013A7F|nr:hypothetical protein [Cupriavidus necator]